MLFGFRLVWRKEEEALQTLWDFNLNLKYRQRRVNSEKKLMKRLLESLTSGT
jgi:hypothetical protein